MGKKKNPLKLGKLFTEEDKKGIPLGSLWGTDGKRGKEYMRFHALITYPDPKVEQIEMLVDADDYIQAAEIITMQHGNEPESIRMSVLDVVNPPGDLPTEIYIKRRVMR